MKHIIEREIELEPIIVPNFILCTGDNHPIPIQDFTDIQLQTLADEFKENLLKRARLKRNNPI